ncbi:MAG: fluoride efflux transporter CrcB [Phycisphaeraceae bacterium]|nr:fluoride efflux transporter CrcB [Phycisphaeraceae bacterium]
MADTGVQAGLLVKAGAVALGGAAGALLRFALAVLTADVMRVWALPLGTLLANLCGCLLAGVALARLVPVWPPGSPVYLLLVTGVLGGLTTFSTFSVEAFNMLHTGRLGAGLLYMAASVLGCMACVALGYFVGSR